MSGKPANDHEQPAVSSPQLSPHQLPIEPPRASRPPPLPVSVMMRRAPRSSLPESVARPRRIELKGSIRIRIPTGEGTSLRAALPTEDAALPAAPAQQSQQQSLRPGPPPPPAPARRSQPPQQQPSSRRSQPPAPPQPSRLSQPPQQPAQQQPALQPSGTSQPPPALQQPSGTSQPLQQPSRASQQPSSQSAAEFADALADSEVDLAIDSAVSTIHGPQRGGPASEVAHPQGEDPGAVDDSLLQVLLDTVRLQSERRLESRGEIGRGGMGSVTEEFDALLQRPTAKKTLLEGVREMPAVVRAFIREAQITGQLDHPNIVPVHDLGIDERGCLFFTMKRVVGRNLGEVLEDDDDNCFVDAKNDRLCARMEIMVKVCDALAFAHSRGVLHCDVKAQNVMVGDYGQVYLMDWGFAQLMPPRIGRRHVEDILPYLATRRERFVLGTPGYMSPEQARGEVLDERADVFSVGALMYLILTGRLLYSAPTPVEAILMAQRGEFKPLDEGTRAMALIPGELARIVNRATAKDREGRYESVDELRAELQQFLRGGSSMPARLLPAGTVIVREGAEGDEAYIIMAGECEVFTGTGAERTTLKTLGPGDVFGEMALLAGAQRMATVVARTDVQIVVVDRKVIEQEVRSMKPWMGAFLQSFTARFRELQQHSETHRSKSPTDERPWWRLKWW